MEIPGSAEAMMVSHERHSFDRQKKTPSRNNFPRHSFEPVIVVHMPILTSQAPDVAK